MPKSRQIGSWFAIIGIALAVQGCWKDEPDRLTLLGDGGCRTAGGSEGRHTIVAVTSPDECKTQCFGENGACTAVEYNANNGHCEVHSEPITKYEPVEGVACYVNG